jgi:AcrR family transcriptional regulator
LTIVIKCCILNQTVVRKLVKMTLDHLKESDDRRQNLILAAYKALTEHGFEGLRVREVAQTVGINPATLYYYFPNKEDLIDSVIAFVFDRLAVTADENPGTPKDQLHAHLSRIYRQMRDEPELFAVLTEIRLRTVRSSTSRVYDDFESTWKTKLVKLLQTGIRQGYWPNYLEPEIIATTIINLMLGAGLQATTQPRRIEESIAQLERWLTGR